MTDPLSDNPTHRSAEGSPHHSDTGSKAALEKWLADSPRVAALCTEIRAVRSDYTSPGTIDQLRTSATRSLEFAKATSLVEKTLNFFGLESARQALLKEQAEKAAATATAAKACNADIEKETTQRIDAFMNGTLTISHDLAALRRFIRMALKDDEETKKKWEAVDHAGTRLEERLTAKSSLNTHYVSFPSESNRHINGWPYVNLRSFSFTDSSYPKFGDGSEIVHVHPNYSGGAIVTEYIPANESQADIEHRRRAVSAVYEQGRREQLGDFAAQLQKWDIPLKAIRGVEFLSITTADGTVIGSLEPRELPIALMADRCAAFHREHPEVQPRRDAAAIVDAHDGIMADVRTIAAAIDGEIGYVRTRLSELVRRP